MDNQRARELAEFYRTTLLQDTLPFWMTHALDDQHGGFLTALDRDGTVIDTDKSVWHQGRFTWLLGELYNNVEPRKDWLDAAVSGANFMEAHCFDKADGRMWFHVTQDGQPLRKRRYAFTESFAAIAFGELAKATGDSRYADLAARCLRTFLEHRPIPKFTDVRPTRGIGAPMIAIGSAQELRESIDLPNANAIIDDAINMIRNFHLHAEHEVVLETVGIDGKPIDHFDGRLLNPGHAIEAAWFILREADHRKSADLLQLGTKMLDWMWKWGWDTEYGGIIYFRDLYGHPPQEYWHDMKFWWPQNEAIIATIYAWLLTGDDRYSKSHAEIHQWAHEHFADPEYGEWFGYLHRDGRVSHEAKGNMWKGPFHLPRMQLIAWQLLERYLKTPPRAIC